MRIDGLALMSGLIKFYNSRMDLTGFKFKWDIFQKFDSGCPSIGLGMG